MAGRGAGLAAAFPYGNELRLDEAEAPLLLNVEPVPVLVEVQGALESGRWSAPSRAWNPTTRNR